MHPILNLWATTFTMVKFHRQLTTLIDSAWFNSCRPYSSCSFCEMGLIFVWNSSERQILGHFSNYISRLSSHYNVRDAKSRKNFWTWKNFICLNEKKFSHIKSWGREMLTIDLILKERFLKREKPDMTQQHLFSSLVLKNRWWTHFNRARPHF